MGIERRVAHVEEGEDDLELRKRVWAEDEAKQGEAIIIERRDLCFLRPDMTNKDELSSSSSTKAKDTSPLRSLPPPSNPEFAHTLTPTPHLLTRYSALTYNAHAIHLDPLYTMIEYKQPGLLVHGPLLLTLMLTCLHHELEGSERIIQEINYRCLSPVFVGESIRVCGKRLTARSGKKEDGEGDERDDDLGGGDGWEVWIEKGGGQQQGGEQARTPALVVRGTVRTPFVGTLTADMVDDAVGFNRARSTKAKSREDEADKMGPVAHDVDDVDEWL